VTPYILVFTSVISFVQRFFFLLLPGFISFPFHSLYVNHILCPKVFFSSSSWFISFPFRSHCPSVSGVKGGFNLPLLYRILTTYLSSPLCQLSTCIYSPTSHVLSLLHTRPLLYRIAYHRETSHKSIGVSQLCHNKLLMDGGLVAAGSFWPTDSSSFLCIFPSLMNDIFFPYGLSRAVLRTM